MTPAHLSQISGLVAHYGYLAVFAAILFASGGVPMPAGELLIAAGVYAAHTHRLSIAILVLVGSLGGLIGGAIGYGIGRSVAAATLGRFGGFVGLSPARIRLGRYLFLTHGGKIVFFVRFIALLGPFGGVLAGANRMPTPRFMVFNALGAVAWTVFFGVGGYLFGTFFEAVGRPLGIGALVLAVAVVAGLIVYVHRHAAALQAKADAMFGV